MNKVILLAPTPPPVGGIASWTVRMMNASLPNEWKVEVVDEKIIGKREFFGDKTKHNIINEVKRCFKIWNGLRRALKDKDAKVVHACIAANTLPVLREYISACITRLCGRKFIIHFRCTVPNMVVGKVNRLAVKLLCNKANCIMLLNEQSKEFIQKMTRTQSCVIPNFVEVDEVLDSHPIREKIERVLYVGGVIESKGCLDIIEIAKKNPEIEFRLIGNVEETCANAAKIVPNVVLKGSMPHEEIRKEMKDADVFMFLTYFSGEGFSNALAEAMASGLPCIVTDWAANRDMIEDKGGVVVPVHGIEEIEMALQSLLNYELRRKCSIFNINKVRNNYADTVVQHQYVSCYEEIVKDEKKN